MTDVCIPFVRLDVSGIDDPLAGMAVILYVAGCPRRCPGCHNPSLQTTQGHPLITVGAVIQHLERVFDESGAATLIEAMVFQGGDWAEYPIAYCELAGWALQKNLRTVLYTGELYENLPKNVREASVWVVDGMWEKDKVSVYPPSSNQRVFNQGRRVDPEELPLHKHLLELRSMVTKQGGS